MRFENRGDYVLFTSEVYDFKKFFDYFTVDHSKFVENNVIINLSSKLKVQESDISLFLKYADLHNENGTTFVMIYPSINVDNFPETFNIVSTLVEAEDVLEIENIQRDLGF